MSALKPEIGDVWIKEWSNIKFVILDFNPTSNDFVAYNKETKNIRLIDAKSPMSSQLKYLGKSKASIKDLFCVKENAENVTQTDLRNIDDMQKKIEFAKEAVDLFFKTEDESKLLEIAEWE